jgi:predicted Zn finger-like uncharacterized protein
MILTCPQCATRYQVDAGKFPLSGRNVRCAKCGHVWHQLGPVPEPDPEAEVMAREPSPTLSHERVPDGPGIAHAPMGAIRAQLVQEEHNEEVRASSLGRAAVAAGWLLLIGLVLAIGWAAVVFRDSVATWLPQTTSLYAAAGLSVNPRGVDIADVAYQRRIEDGQVVLAVSGNIVNRSTHELSVPPVRIALFDADKHELYHWTYVAAVSTLRPGQATRFRTRLASPPAGTHDLEVRFAKAGE